MLAIILFSALTGGALAYKADRALNTFYINSADNRCVSQTRLNYITDVAGTITIFAATVSMPSSVCPILTVKPYL